MYSKKKTGYIVPQGRGAQIFQKIWHPPHISLCHQGVMKPVPYEEPTSFRL